MHKTLVHVVFLSVVFPSVPVWSRLKTLVRGDLASVSGDGIGEDLFVRLRVTVHIGKVIL